MFGHGVRCLLSCPSLSSLLWMCWMLWVLFSHMVLNLRDGVTPAGSRLVWSSIGTKVWVCFSFPSGLVLHDGVTLWVESVFDLILDRNIDFFVSLLGWFRAFTLASPISRVSWRWASTPVCPGGLPFLSLYHCPSG